MIFEVILLRKLKLKNITAKTVLLKFPFILTIITFICGIIRIVQGQQELFDRLLVVIPLLLMAEYAMCKVMISDIDNNKDDDTQQERTNQ